MRNGSGNLGAHLDRGDGIYRASGFHHLANFTAVYLGREILWLLITPELKGGIDSYRDNDQGSDQPIALQYVQNEFLTFSFRTFSAHMSLAVSQSGVKKPREGLWERIKSLALYRMITAPIFDGTSCVRVTRKWETFTKVY